MTVRVFDPEADGFTRALLGRGMFAPCPGRQRLIISRSPRSDRPRLEPPEVLDAAEAWIWRSVVDAASGGFLHSIAQLILRQVVCQSAVSDRHVEKCQTPFNRATAACGLSTGTERTPVLSLQMVNRPNEKRFYSQLMDVIGAPPNPRTSVADLEIVVLRMLRQLDLKMLLIDETHNILASTYNDQRAMLNLLRFISNELRVSIVCFGVSDAKEAISGDVQLARRFQEFDLPRWKADEKFQTLVIGILRNLPLRLPSILSTRALRRVLQVSDGVTSQIFGLLYEAAELAIRTQRECIDDDLMDEIHTRSAPKVSYA